MARKYGRSYAGSTVFLPGRRQAHVRREDRARDNPERSASCQMLFPADSGRNKFTCAPRPPVLPVDPTAQHPDASPGSTHRARQAMLQDSRHPGDALRTGVHAAAGRRNR